ncbi:hypothetical protein Adt_45778 [Abeliophyllum distichum]|uniref:Uncharacterized protein n=1 Tax=Abeliophyllum distichum TaxID=126358 RepID=A0ABD1PEP7_9LAMI
MRLCPEVVEELERKNEELAMKESEIQALAHEVEEDKRKKSKLDTLLEKEPSIPPSCPREENVFFLTMEELIETVVRNHLYWDVQFLKDELDEFKKNSKFNTHSSREED